MFTHNTLLRLNHRVVADDNCWIWTGSRDSDGYGHVRVSGKLKKVHRFVYETLHQPTRQHVHHKCHVKACCRPEHLEAIDPIAHGRMHGGDARRSGMVCERHGVAKVAQGEGNKPARMRCRICRMEQQRARRSK